MKGMICKVCGEEYNGRKDSFFCCLGCKSKWHRHRRNEISRIDIVYLARKAQSYETSGNSIAEKYLTKEDADRLKGAAVKGGALKG